MNPVDALLEQAAPTPDDNPDWIDILQRAGVGDRSRRRRGTLLLVAAAIAALAAVAVPTIALSGTMQQWLGFSGHPGPVTEKARFIVEAPAGGDVVLRLYAAPFSDGGACEFGAFARAGSPTLPVQMNGGGFLHERLARRATSWGAVHAVGVGGSVSTCIVASRRPVQRPACRHWRRGGGRPARGKSGTRMDRRLRAIRLQRQPLPARH